MELYLHTVGSEDPELIETDSASPISDLVVVGAGEDPMFLWRENEDEPLAIEGALADAGIANRDHLHRGRCHHVQVTIRFGGRELPHSFAPAATIERVFEWATGKHAFDLSPEQRAKHVLALPGADHFLAWTVHIGSLTNPVDCAVVLDLAAEESFEG